VEEARRSLEEKAEQLTLTSKYKSEFLANMSHELRTPLNSLLILAQQLYENNEGNLNDRQIKFARTIHSCGDDLIQLINDILDLSKIESGIISADILPVSFSEIANFAESTFKPISETKNLNFEIEVSKELPEVIETDIQRLNQILKNLLSNAFKFTEKGNVKLIITKETKGNETVIAFAIKDTGIGISKKTQGIIFEAFQQAEGSTSRKYGGTGLGLSISKGFAELLGGTITVESILGKGSEFTLYLPLKYKFTSLSNPERTKQIYSHDERSTVTDATEDLIEDDRDLIQRGDQVLLVVEDDIRFVKILNERAHEYGMKVVAANSHVELFDFINKYNPVAITLDLKLPGANGLKILRLLKSDLNYRHIPIYVISGEESKEAAFKLGARDFYLKPLSNQMLNQIFTDIKNLCGRKVKNVLLIEDNKTEFEHLNNFLSNEAINITGAHTTRKALAMAQKNHYDCIILDYALSDKDGLELLNQINTNKEIKSSIIIHSARDFAVHEQTQIKKLSHRIIPKTPGSQNKLLQEVTMLLHVDSKFLPEEKFNLLKSNTNDNDVLNGKKALIVDDDVRNLFALTAAFERMGLIVSTAESGKEALEILEGNKNIDIVLMDIMMPEMDGYETIKRIRRDKHNHYLPIIAVTAKAMKGDRQKCIASGASDYITKPVKIDQLFSLMRIWLTK
jgi:CheY-like chemotaxis protein/nitrogen-specific signal transduction histidine kinase